MNGQLDLGAVRYYVNADSRRGRENEFGMSSVERASWFEKIPKVELHLHLEGAIPHRALWELIQKYGAACSGRGAETREPQQVATGSRI